MLAGIPSHTYRMIHAPTVHTLIMGWRTLLPLDGWRPDRGQSPTARTALRLKREGARARGVSIEPPLCARRAVWARWRAVAQQLLESAPSLPESTRGEGQAVIG
eukprot:scaffold153952_cov32-Tisochrysis_lutea.AAC.4